MELVLSNGFDELTQEEMLQLDGGDAVSTVTAVIVSASLLTVGAVVGGAVGGPIGAKIGGDVGKVVGTVVTIAVGEVVAAGVGYLISEMSK